jgi:hypothetical protein
MQALFREAAPRDEDIRTAFARSARMALAGLFAAPAALGLASATGHPLRAAVGPAFWVCALAGFAGAGWLAGRRLGVRPPRAAALAATFVAAGLMVAPAFRGLQDLTGHESMLVVTAATLPRFAAAFMLTGALGGQALGVARVGARGLLTCAAGGLLGGALAMLPFVWAWLRLDVPGEVYLVFALAVVGFLGCLIAPFHAVGIALDRARRGETLARV